MPFTITQFGPYQVVRPTANMTIEHAVEDQQTLEALLKETSDFEVVVDLSRIECIDAAGVGVLTAAATKGKARGHRIILYRPNKHAIEVMKEAEIYGFFPVFINESDFLSRLPD